MLKLLLIMIQLIIAYLNRQISKKAGNCKYDTREMEVNYKPRALFLEKVLKYYYGQFKGHDFNPIEEVYGRKN